MFGVDYLEVPTNGNRDSELVGVDIVLAQRGHYSLRGTTPPELEKRSLDTVSHIALATTLRFFVPSLPLYADGPLFGIMSAIVTSG